MKRRLVALAALLGGALAGFQLFKRLRGEQGRNRVDLYYEDGSLVSLSGAEAAPLLTRAREALRATHGA
jgi:hypothetical protein